jgi:uncharacterized membrane protein
MKMEKNINKKKEIVKMLLKDTELQDEDEEELIDLLINQPLSIDIDKMEEAKMTKGDKLADKLSAKAGSWPFIIIFLVFMISWIILNTIGAAKLDKYPFILLNLMLSCIAAIQAPIIMMTQNRQAEKDSLRNQNDYRIDLKSELILEQLHDKINLMVRNQNKILKILEEDPNTLEEGEEVHEEAKDNPTN